MTDLLRLAAVIVMCTALADQSVPRMVPIMVPVRAWGQDLRPLQALTVSDLDVRIDDGIPVTMELLEPDARPITLALIVDTTVSVPAARTSELHDAIERTVFEGLRPGDRVRVTDLVPPADAPAGFPADRRALQSSFESLFRRSARDRSGPSPIWDAVWRETAILSAELGRRVMLMVTDGRASGNIHGAQDALREVIRANVSVDILYAGARDVLPQGSGRAALVQPDVLLREMAEHSGGAVFNMLEWKTDRPRVINPKDVLQSIVNEWRRTWLLRVSVPADGKYHRLLVKSRAIGVTVRAPLIVLAPSGNP